MRTCTRTYTRTRARVQVESHFCQESCHGSVPDLESVRAFCLSTSSPVSSCIVLPKARFIDIFFYTRNLLGLLSCFGKEPAQQSSLANSHLGRPALSLCNVLSHLAELHWDTSKASSRFLLLFFFPISPGSEARGIKLLVPHSAPNQGISPPPPSWGSRSCLNEQREFETSALH